jgi:hypothetical protein
MKMAVFWDVAPCSLLEVYQQLRGACCLYQQSDISLRKVVLHGVRLAEMVVEFCMSFFNISLSFFLDMWLHGLLFFILTFVSV